MTFPAKLRVGEGILVKRRTLLTAAGAAAASRPFAARSQQAGRTYRIGIVSPQLRSQPHYVALVEALGRLGFVDGKNLEIDWQGFELKPEQYASHAKELVDAKVDLIFGGTGEPVRIVQKTTSTIPILTIADDMVGEGLVQSLARPGGNTTGVSLLGAELDGKRQEILIELLPGVRRLAALADPLVALPRALEAIEAAARGRSIELTIHKIASATDIAPAIDKAKAAGAQGLNVLASVVLFINRRIIIERTAAIGLPAIYQWPEYVDQGAFAGYGPRLAQIFRDHMAPMAAAMLRGTKPGDLPVQQPTTFQLAINLKVAKALGITVPPPLLVRADEVVE
jgi:putative ABC transport system substrate-binding protein